MDPEEPHHEDKHQQGRRSRAAAVWEFLTHHQNPTPTTSSSAPKSYGESFKRGHFRTPSVPIPDIKINCPSEEFGSDGGGCSRKGSARRLERSMSSFEGAMVSEGKSAGAGENHSSDEGFKALEEDFSGKKAGRKLPSAINALLSPYKRSGSKLELPHRQRSKSYSDLYKPGEKVLPELTLDEVKAILMQNKMNRELRKGSESGSSVGEGGLIIPLVPVPPPMPELPLFPSLDQMEVGGSMTSLKGYKGISNLIVPGETFTSQIKSAAGGISGSKSSIDIECSSGSGAGQQQHLKNLSTTKGGIQRKNRPRNLSQPAFSVPDSILSAPAYSSQHNSMGIKFLRPYFRRASQISTPGLVLAESMVSLTNRALVSFIIEDNYGGLQHLLESRRVAVDDRDENGCTALMIAAQRGKSNFVRALLEHGADINGEDSDNWTALLFATKEGHDEIVSDLLDHGVSVDHRDMGGWTALMWACYKGRIKAARLLMNKGADINAYGNYNVTCLSWACGRGHSEIAKDLLQRGAKVNVGDKYGTTALIWAARKGYIEIVDMLLNAEANVDACGMTSWTPLLVAAAGNHVEVVKIILEHKPNVNTLDKDGCSALTIACKEGFHEIAVSLINHGAYINISDRGGTSNLIHAAKGGHRSIVEALLKKHADVNVQGKDRKSALYWAVEKSHVPVVKLLLSAQPDLELATKDGDTPLMKAVRNRNHDIVSLLLDKRAKVSAADKNGDTCLHIAMRARSKQIVELLLRNPAHSQLLYRPNRAGETPYNIDRTQPKPIIPQIFGSRGLNTQEDGENLLGYNLYSSALADMLSDPSLNMPITVGLFARWGSGKSFLLGKLRDEMKSFARQWLNPTFAWNFLIFVTILCFSAIVGVVAGLAIQSWIAGVAFAAGVTIMFHVFLLCVWFSSNRSKYEWSWSNRVSNYLANKFESLKLLCQVVFCHPPGSQSSSDQLQAQPINFYFSEQTKISTTTGGENSVVQMLGSLYNCIENDYGVISSRLYRAFKPRPVAATADWKWRKLCCIPYCVIFLFCFACTLIAVVVLALYLTGMGMAARNYTGSLAIIMYSCTLVVGFLLVANIYTVGQVFKAVVFSHRRHLQRTVAKLYAVKAEGFLHALRAEVNLMTDMVRCLDAFTGRQTRMVLIVDGLDSAEQEKVLQVLDAVHILFSDSKAPFVILLAIDPHIITKIKIFGNHFWAGIDMNINPVLNESNIGGHDYLRNLVHLPFFLQNAALRKVKHVKMLENSMKRSSRLEEDPGPHIFLSTRRPSVESGFGVQVSLEPKVSSKKPKRLGMKMSESVASSLGSNLNRITSAVPLAGPSDLKKMLLGDDYFSDVNPRSMRRLMNIIHITGRLLKCFSIDFNWYHLSAWVNVTEQWPYRLSWMIIYCEHYQKDLDDGTSLKNIFERVRTFIPTSKELDQNLALDRDEKKLDAYLGLHKASLLVSTLYVFLPFTISLDPQIRKDLTEQYQPIEEIFKSSANFNHPLPLAQAQGAFPFTQGGGPLTPNPQGLRYRGLPQKPLPVVPPTPQLTSGFPSQFPPGLPHPYNPANIWYPGNLPPNFMFPQQNLLISSNVSSIEPALMRDLKNKKLSMMTVDGVCDLLVSLTGIKSSQITRYQETVRKNNINGRVLLTCDLNELKEVFKMTFGDWEMFKSALCILREGETSKHVFEHQDENLINNNKEIRINVTSPSSGEKSASRSTDTTDLKTSQLRPNILEKQVTMEEQMICGALELLNDEAREDARKGQDSPSTLSPINSEPEQLTVVENRRPSKPPLPLDETDVLYVMGIASNMTAELPDSPSVVRRLSEFNVVNESQHSLRSTLMSSDPIAIPGNGKSPGGKRRPSTFTKNLSFSGSVPIGSPFKSQSLGTKDFKPQSFQYHRVKSPVGREPSSRKPKHASSSSSHKLHAQDASSTEASSDESQTPLVMKPMSGDKHGGRKAIILKSSGKQPKDTPGSPKKKRVIREDSFASKFSKIKSTFFGQSQTSQSSQSIEFKTSGGKPMSTEIPQEYSSEAPRHFKDPSTGHPWTMYTTQHPFAASDYYEAMKSNNPTTTSNESELGSTPEEISSKEELFLPGPPELPESPYPGRSGQASPNPQSRFQQVEEPHASHLPPPKAVPSKFTVIVHDSNNGIPMKPVVTSTNTSSSSPRKSKKHKSKMFASSGEEAVGSHLRRSQKNRSTHRSDPVLSISGQESETLIPMQVLSHDAENDDGSTPTPTPGTSRDHGQVPGSSPPLTRQAAVTNSDNNSSRENTPGKS